MKIIELKNKNQVTHLSNKKVESVCHLLHQLYPNLSLTRSELINSVDKRINSGYHFLIIENEKQVIGVCIFNIYESFAWGKYMYISDFVIDNHQRSKNFGLSILEYLQDFAKLNQVKSIQLDSKLDRVGARKFYIKNGFDIFAFHYRKDL